MLVTELVRDVEWNVRGSRNTHLHTLLSLAKGVYREEGMQLAPFSESSDFVLSYF